MNLLFFSGDVPIHEWLWSKILVAKSQVSIPLAKLSTAVSKILHLLSWYIYIYAILSFLLVIAFPTGWVGVAIHLDVQPFRDWIASPVTGGWLSHGKTHTTQKSSNDQAHRHKSSPIIISSYKFYQFLSQKKQSWIDIYIYIHRCIHRYIHRYFPYIFSIDISKISIDILIKHPPRGCCGRFRWISAPPPTRRARRAWPRPRRWSQWRRSRCGAWNDWRGAEGQTAGRCPNARGSHGKNGKNPVKNQWKVTVHSDVIVDFWLGDVSFLGVCVFWGWFSSWMLSWDGICRDFFAFER